MSGPSTASTRGVSPQGEAPLQIDSGAPKVPVERVHAEREPFPDARIDRSRPAPAPRLRGRAGGASAARSLQAPLGVESRRRGSGSGGTGTGAIDGRDSRGLGDGEGDVTMDLSIDYLGFHLPHPFMPGSSPLVDDLDMVRRLEDAGAAAIVMHSLFEEQIVGEELAMYKSVEATGESSPEARSYLPDPEEFALGHPRLPRAGQPHQGGGLRPRHRLLERHDPGELDRVRAADGAGGRRRAGDQRLRSRDRSARDGRGRRAPRARGRRGRSAKPSESRSRSSSPRSTPRSRTSRDGSSTRARTAS